MVSPLAGGGIRLPSEGATLLLENRIQLSWRRRLQKRRSRHSSPASVAIRIGKPLLNHFYDSARPAYSIGSRQALWLVKTGCWIISL
jgi:hypothetical protein